MDHMGRNDRPRTDFDCRLLHQQPLEKEVKPVLQRKNVNEATDKRKLFSSNHHMTFVQDGAPAHAAKATQAWRKKNLPNFIEKTCWLPNSPDIDPAENLWSIMYEVVYKDPTPKTMKDLKRRLKQAWKKIPLSTLHDLSHCMPQRLPNVITNKGGMPDIDFPNIFTQ